MSARLRNQETFGRQLRHKFRGVIVRSLGWNMELATDRLGDTIQAPSFNGPGPDDRTGAIGGENGPAGKIDEHYALGMQGRFGIGSNTETQ